MMELVKVALDALGGVVAQWIKGSAEERAELERRTHEAVQVMRGERKATHDALEATDAESRRVIEEARAKLREP